MRNLKFIVLAVLVLAGLCALVAANTKGTLTCETGTKYKCPQRKEWRCKCPHKKAWCWEAHACVPEGTQAKERKHEECNNRCVYGKIEKVKDNQYGKHHDKCKCKRGWFGPYCNQKEVNLKYSKKYHKECGKDLECKKRITVKCRCKDHDHGSSDSYTTTSDSSSYSGSSSSEGYYGGWKKHRYYNAKVKDVKAKAVKQADIGLNAEQKLN